MNQRKIRFIKIILVLILVQFVFYFVFRNQVLVNKVNAKVDGFNSTHDAKIHFEKVCFKGFVSLHFDSLLVTPNSNDTLIFIGSLSARLNIIQLFTGHIRFKKLSVEHAEFKLEHDKIDSYYKSFSRISVVQKQELSEKNLYAISNKLLRRIFNSIPAQLNMIDVSARYIEDTLLVKANVDLFTLKNGTLSSIIHINQGKYSQNAVLDGEIKPGHRTLEISMKPQEMSAMLHSPLAYIFGADFSYKSMTFRFTEKKNKNDLLTIEGSFALDKFNVDYPALSSKQIAFPGCSMKFDLSIGPRFIEVDSISEMNLGELSLHPYLKYSLSPADTVIISFLIPTFTVDEFFSSLPPDVFSNLNNLEAEGSFSNRTKMVVDLNRPDSLILESKIDTKKFKLKHLDPNLLKMNTSFVFTAYEKGKPVRNILVGSENPDFVPLDQVPLLLQNAIMMAEDASFFYHKGFLISGIRRALAENIREHKFSRGGSTISQQLVKNVYLSREKTISRKLEELIIVWLIESNHLVSKSRMFEVYLNIIEWGPNVYGVKEASGFYFQKRPDQLNASECIFLASVIPSPKKFYYRFNRQGKLAPFMVGYFNDMSGKLQYKGLISSANGDSISSMLNITGRAKTYLRFDTIRIDTISNPLLYNEMDEE